MPQGASGHVFVVHGRVETVVHDAAVVPTDDGFGVGATWNPVLEIDDPASLRPSGWPCDGHGRAAGDRPVWFISVGDGDGLATDLLVERAVGVVHDVAEARIPPASNRVKPVLAMPVLGLEGGGHDRDRGDVVKALLEALHAAVAGVDLDIAVVTPDASVYAAAQHVRSRIDPGTVGPELAEHAQRLGLLARSGDLALFLGAGVSMPAGLPAWREMLGLLGERTHGLTDVDLLRLSPLDQAQLLRKRVPDLGEHVAAICREHLRPSLAHALLAGLGSRAAVTTNYDRLYEQAVRATGRGAVSVMPWESPVGRPAWVLKMHGDLTDPGSIVLTRRDFVRFDARTRPAGSVLQTLLMTRHVMIVGASMTDDNVVRLAQEVEVYREDHGLECGAGTLLDVDDDASRSELWEGQLTWLTMAGATVEERVRSLEIFLDTVARCAADDASWLLDPRFGGLLDTEGQVLAEEARELRGRLRRAGGEWRQLTTVLDALGAPDD
jgi:hypothetical protein